MPRFHPRVYEIYLFLFFSVRRSSFPLFFFLHQKACPDLLYCLHQQTEDLFRRRLESGCWISAEPFFSSLPFPYSSVGLCYPSRMVSQSPDQRPVLSDSRGCSPFLPGFFPLPSVPFPFSNQELPVNGIDFWVFVRVNSQYCKQRCPSPPPPLFLPTILLVVVYAFFVRHPDTACLPLGRN